MLGEFARWLPPHPKLQEKIILEYVKGQRRNQRSTNHLHLLVSVPCEIQLSNIDAYKIYSWKFIPSISIKPIITCQPSISVFFKIPFQPSTLSMCIYIYIYTYCIYICRLMYCILHQKSIHLIPSIHQQAAGVSSYTPTLPLVFPAFELRRALRATPSTSPWRATLTRLPRQLRTPREWRDFPGMQVLGWEKGCRMTTWSMVKIMVLSMFHQQNDGLIMDSWWVPPNRHGGVDWCLRFLWFLERV